MKTPERTEIAFSAVTMPWKQLPDYPDIGSWRCFKDGSPAFVGAADTGNAISNMGILIHEIWESFRCWQNGVTEAAVREFDQKWFKEEEDGVKHIHESPGDDPTSPYHIYHVEATWVERHFIGMCGMMWEKHETNCESVYKDA